MNRVNVRTLKEAFDRVFDRLDYTLEQRTFLLDAAKNDNAKAYACYQAILNSRSYPDAPTL